MFYTEIINSKTGDVLDWSDTGEVVLTPLLKNGFPLLRYRTKDISYVTDEPCKCGRTSARLAKIQGLSLIHIFIGFFIRPICADDTDIMIAYAIPHRMSAVI